MRLLIVGLNYAPERVGIAIYTSGMAEALAAEGHKVRVISGQPYYPAWRIADGYNAWSFTLTEESGVAVTRVPHYIPADPTGSKRLLHHASFAASALLPAIWQGLAWRPDVVLTVAPSLIGAPVARLAAALAGARSWLHVAGFRGRGGLRHRAARGQSAGSFGAVVRNHSAEKLPARQHDLSRDVQTAGGQGRCG